MSDARAVIAVTMGDPAGIGPEIVLKGFCDDGMWTGAVPVIYGDYRRLEATLERLALPLELAHISEPGEAVGRYPTLEVIDFANVEPAMPHGEVQREAGRAALDYIEAATADALAGRVAALVTAPISKEALRRAGSQFSGHTDLLAAASGTSHYAMTLVAGGLRAIFVTAHMPLADVPGSITRRRVLETTRLAGQALSLLGEPGAKIAVLGLNPHAGEAGYMGSEESEAILPAIKAAQQEGIHCDGPVPADTAFYRMKKGEFAIAVTMYHDQGHIPLKLVAFETGVNWTVGLPFVRTSPDHGTAFDIAGKGKARAESLKSAYLFARRLVDRKVAQA